MVGEHGASGRELGVHDAGRQVPVVRDGRRGLARPDERRDPEPGLGLHHGAGADQRPRSREQLGSLRRIDRVVGERVDRARPPGGAGLAGVSAAQPVSAYARSAARPRAVRAARERSGGVIGCSSSRGRTTWAARTRRPSPRPPCPSGRPAQARTGTRRAVRAAHDCSGHHPGRAARPRRASLHRPSWSSTADQGLSLMCINIAIS